MQKKFGLLGFPLNHSLSPYIHNRLFSIANKASSYSLFNVKPEDLNMFFKELDSIDGFNITMPYKNLAFKKVPLKSQQALKFKTINTAAKTKDGILKGYNTDYFGFFKTLAIFNIKLNKNILLLGLGGAGKIVAKTSLLSGAFLTVAVRNISLKKAELTLKSIISEKFHKKFSIVALEKIPNKPFNVIINATPVGMHPLLNLTPINTKFLIGCNTVIDLIYNPFETALLKAAKSLKIKAINGLYMLVFQAIKSNEIFTKTIFKSTVAFNLFKEAAKFLS